MRQEFTHKTPKEKEGRYAARRGHAHEYAGREAGGEREGLFAHRGGRPHHGTQDRDEGRQKGPGRERREDMDERDLTGRRGAGRPGHGGPQALMEERMGGSDDTQLLFVGSLNCIRHKPYMGIGELMQQGRGAILCPTMADFSTGRYVDQVVDAVAELSRERNSRHFVLCCGCQWTILSTDGELIRERVKKEYGVDLEIREDGHLEFGDHE